MKTLKLTILAVFGLGIFVAYAEVLDTLPGFFAGSGKLGIYVIWHGTPMASWRVTPEGYIGFNVYRKSQNDKEFRRINDEPVSIAKSASEMKNMLGKKVDDWLIFTKIPDADSLYKLVRNPTANLIGWASFDIDMLQVLGLSYLDTNVKKGERYVYRLTLVRKDKTETSPSGEFEVEFGKPPRPLFGPLNFRASGGDRVVELKWEPNLNDTLGFMFMVYRSGKKDGPYIPLNERPIILFRQEGKEEIPEGFYSDKDVVNGVTYYYKVTSMDFLGNESPFVGPVEATPKDLTPPPAPQRPVAEGSARGIIITWERSKANDVKGYWVYRSESFDGEYKKLNVYFVPPDTNFYEDITVEPNKEYYYKISAVDYADNESPLSAPCFSSFQNYLPPAPPQNVKAIPTGPKEITISWSPNTEQDLRGYYVMRAFRPDGKFEQVSHLISKDTTFFIDRDKILSRKSTYFYAVVAVNRTGIWSPYSAVVGVEVVDTTGPLAPLGFHGWWNEAGIHLFWSPSIDPSTSGWAIFKAEGKTNSTKRDDYKPLVILARGEKSYVDKDVKRGKAYTYLLFALNIDGFMSEPTPPLVVYTGGAIKTPPPSLNILRKPDGLLIVWDKTMEEGIKAYRIYKSLGGANYSLLKELDVKTTSYLDKEVKPGNLYYYYIKTVDENGVEGSASEKVNITY